MQRQVGLMCAWPVKDVPSGIAELEARRNRKAGRIEPSVRRWVWQIWIAAGHYIGALCSAAVQGIYGCRDAEWLASDSRVMPENCQPPITYRAAAD